MIIDHYNKVNRPGTTTKVDGLDTFTGLPRDWQDMPDIQFDQVHFSAMGHFGVNSVSAAASSVYSFVSDVLSKASGGDSVNIVLHAALIEESLPILLESRPNSPIAFLHVDCALGDTTVTSLELLRERLIPGSVIVFDEAINFTNWSEKGEFAAWCEFSRKFSICYKWLSRAADAPIPEIYVLAEQQVAVQIVSC